MLAIVCKLALALSYEQKPERFGQIATVWHRVCECVRWLRKEHPVGTTFHF